MLKYVFSLHNDWGKTVFGEMLKYRVDYCKSSCNDKYFYKVNQNGCYYEIQRISKKEFANAYNQSINVNERDFEEQFLAKFKQVGSNVYVEI